MDLPVKFEQRMQQQLGDEYKEFIASYDNTRVYALRLNRLKRSGDKSAIDFLGDKFGDAVLWEPAGRYYSDEMTPGKHAYHEIGMYYIQEPSAMSAVPKLCVKPGDTVLDLCAAPGGKTTQIASYMQGDGLLVSNEINRSRAKILAENVERMGVTNAIVTCESPDVLSTHFPCFFDKILVDAPCSGEGMFRKNPEAVLQWSEENVDICAKRQDDILDEAIKMLRPGGRLVYSTCTFAPAEDEECMARLTERHPNIHLLESNRLWPHRDRGEGHYVAVLEADGVLIQKKAEFAANSTSGGREKSKQKGKNNSQNHASGGSKQVDYAKELAQWATDNLRNEGILAGKYEMFGDSLFVLPEYAPSLQGIHVESPGLWIGDFKKNRFEPAHALALALSPEDVVRTFDLRGDSNEAKAYLNGQALSCDGPNGWTLVTLDGFSAGWGKVSGGMLKNHYPKGLRIQYSGY